MKKVAKNSKRKRQTMPSLSFQEIERLISDVCYLKSVRKSKNDHFDMLGHFFGDFHRTVGTAALWQASKQLFIKPSQLGRIMALIAGICRLQSWVWWVVIGLSFYLTYNREKMQMCSVNLKTSFNPCNQKSKDKLRENAIWSVKLRLMLNWLVLMLIRLEKKAWFVSKLRRESK